MGTNRERAKCPLVLVQGSPGLISHDGFLPPAPNQVPFSVASCPLGTSHKGGLWLPPGVSKYPGEVLKPLHLGWHLACLEKGLHLVPAPHPPPQVTHSKFSSGPKNFLQDTLLPAVSPEGSIENSRGMASICWVLPNICICWHFYLVINQ